MHDDGSDARRALGFITPDRWRAVEEMRGRVESVARAKPHFEEAVTALREASGDGGDFGSIALSQLAAFVLPAMREASGDSLKRSIDRLAFGSVPDEDAGARMAVHPDGSGSVLLSDSLISLIGYLAALTIGFADYQATEGVEQIAVALRYYLLHRRVFGLSGMLGVVTPPGSDDRRAALANSGLMFVLAHEAAHFCLRHDNLRGQPGIELEADRLAFATVSLTLAQDIPDEGPLLTSAGARIALLATALAESALFVHRPSTHPSAARRWQSLADGIDPAQRTRATAYTDALATAAGKAGDLLLRLPAEWWDAGLRSEIVAADMHDAEYYESIRSLDQLGFGGPDEPADALYMVQEHFRVDLVTPVKLAVHEGAGAGLRALGIAANDAAHLSDATQPLSFHSLLEAVRQSPVLSAVTEETMNTMFALCAATLLAGVMQGLYPM